MSGDRMFTSCFTNSYENNFCLPIKLQKIIKLNVQNHVYLIFMTNQISLKTAVNITRFDPYSIGAHNWNIILSGNFVQHTEEFAGHCVRQLKISTTGHLQCPPPYIYLNIFVPLSHRVAILSRVLDFQCKQFPLAMMNIATCVNHCIRRMSHHVV